MKKVLQKTLGGLNGGYYFRHFIFGLIFGALMCYMATQGEQIIYGMIFFAVINTLLYPYSRFIYESIVGYIMGDNVFFVNAMFLLISKFITMLMCWAFAIFVAPLGMLYLYYYHSKHATFDERSDVE